MIQLNNLSAAASSPIPDTLTTSTDPASLDSFESALSDAISQTLQQFGINPNSVNISIAPAAGTPDSSAAAAPAANANASSPADVVSSLAPFMNNPANASSAPAAAPQASETPESPEQSFDDTYWANQPEPVQQLRTIGDIGARTQMATQLASEGYKIDVPIMVWGWDPSQVTSLRQSYGYTWVPSALQNPVAVAPGLTVPGMQTYDPNNPPTGSIAV